ncbi:potassium/proton antiporter [Amaricoccus macauensis]|uniref:potassium/proton antiporter n=1 Tax=Amaricoccus macauensis TaxID=57001 RepID=UPI003C7E47DD
MTGIVLVNTALFIGAALVLIGIFSSLIATRFGVPLLLVFLVVGMLAGQDGPGGIVYNDYQSTYLIGSLALSVILFDGGLRTRLSVFRGVLAPSLILATVGVVITASVAGLAAWSVLDLTPLEGLLLGSIVASTDAAAVFFLLRTGGLRLQSRVGSTLEIESGTNDPIAVFLVFIITEIALSPSGAPSFEMLLRLAEQASLGALMGLAFGFSAVWILNNLSMAGGLHPLFVVASAILISAFTGLLGGSGLLAVYLAGLVMGNKPTRAYPSIVGFHEAMTWLCQIVMFLVLGLLVTPSTLWNYALPGMFVALVLTFVARPLSVWLCLSPFGYERKDKLFISWVGLRGAVSIFLAAIPTLAGIEQAEAFFNVAFFVVLFSLLLQGSTLTTAARKLGLALKSTMPNLSRVELDIPGQVEQELAGYPVTPDTIILGLSRVPPWARPLMVVRDGQILDLTEAGRLRAGDYAYFLVERKRLTRLDSLFRASPDVSRRLTQLTGELPIVPDAKIADVAAFYDLEFDSARSDTRVGDWMREHLKETVELDSSIRIEGATLSVRRMESGQISRIGLQLDALTGVEPDEKLLQRIEEEVDELSQIRRWLKRLRPWRKAAR